MKYDDFVPEKEISMDKEHTLEQISGRFRSVKDGLPELVKNSKDHYSRKKIREKKERQIVIIVSADEKNLGVLDFAGASLEDFSGWRTWSSRTAGRTNLAEDIEAGHGNGGKSFMVRGGSIKAGMCGCVNEKLNKWGFKNDEPSLKFRAGIFKDKSGKEIKNLSVNDVKKILNEELYPFDLSFNSLPAEVKEIFEKRNTFTFVSLFGIKDWENVSGLPKQRLIKYIPTDLMTHAQAALTIETCNVWVMKGEKLLFPNSLEVSDFLPFEGLEKIPPIKIPKKLIDPSTNEEIDLKFKNESRNLLTIKTSRQNLRLSDRLKPRNVIRVKNERNVVANWSMADLVSLSSSAFLYGTLICEFLKGDHVSGSDRLILADTSLTRALKHWTSEKLTEIAKKLSHLQYTKNSEEEISTTSETLEKLRDLMNQYLQEKSIYGDEGEENKEGKTKKHKKKKSKISEVDEIILESPGRIVNIAEGSTIPLVYRCYKKTDGKKKLVKFNSLVLCIDRPGIVDWIRESFIKGIKKGSTKIFFETGNKKVRSNIIEVNVHEVDYLDVTKVETPLKQGESIKLKVVPFKKDGKAIANMIYDAHVDEIEMGKINRYCAFTAGGLEGNATVRIKYGKDDKNIHILNILIGPEKIEGTGGSKGKGSPLILLCGTPAPGEEDSSEESRTHPPGEDYPTLIDYDPLWEGIVWINHESKESKKVRMRGEGGTMKINCRTFQQFLALKCFEILKRLKVRESFKDESKNITEFIQEIAQAEMDTAGFLERAYELVQGIINGEQND